MVDLKIGGLRRIRQGQPVEKRNYRYFKGHGQPVETAGIKKDCPGFKLADLGTGHPGGPAQFSLTQAP